MLVALATYTAPDGTPREVALLMFGPPPVSPPVPAVLAVRLDGHPALVIDRPRDGQGDVRLLAELRAGEGLVAVHALIDDYLPRAHRATRPLARSLGPQDLLGPSDDEPADQRREPDASEPRRRAA